MESVIKSPNDKFKLRFCLCLFIEISLEVFRIKCVMFEEHILFCLLLKNRLKFLLLNIIASIVSVPFLLASVCQLTEQSCSEQFYT